MQTKLPNEDERIDESCDDCAALLNGWPCADCFIAGDAEIHE